MIDITRRISNASPNWPGDTPVQYSQTASITQGSSVNVASVTLSTHTGTHVDAPWHYIDHGLKLHEVPLETWVGPCVVVDASSASVLNAALLEDVDLTGVTKVLFHTGQPNIWLEFPTTWAHIDPDLPPFLAAHGVSLIGTDAPSAEKID